MEGRNGMGKNLGSFCKKLSLRHFLKDGFYAHLMILSPSSTVALLISASADSLPTFLFIAFPSQESLITSFPSYRFSSFPPSLFLSTAFNDAQFIVLQPLFFQPLLSPSLFLPPFGLHIPLSSGPYSTDWYTIQISLSVSMPPSGVNHLSQPCISGISTLVLVFLYQLITISLTLRFDFPFVLKWIRSIWGCWVLFLLFGFFLIDFFFFLGVVFVDEQGILLPLTQTKNPGGWNGWAKFSGQEATGEAAAGAAVIHISILVIKRTCSGELRRDHRWTSVFLFPLLQFDLLWLAYLLTIQLLLWGLM